MTTIQLNRPVPPRRGSGRTLACVVLALGFLFAASRLLQAQLLPENTVVSRSVSGQFVVQAVPGIPSSRVVSLLGTNQAILTLDATLLPVSCERIKQVLYRELGETAPWVGRIHLRLYPVRGVEDPVTIASEYFRDGWIYQVRLPTMVERSTYLRAVVEALLLEIANRKAGSRSTEVPAWLAEGLTEQLLHSDESELVLMPPRPSQGGIRLATTLVETRRKNPLETAHKVLSAAEPLTFQQLSWPTEQEFAGEAGKVYRSSAQLFVSELLGLPTGPACLRAMLEDLPQYYNWQFAFLHAFHRYFQRPLDIEKWWSLHVLHFTNRDLAQTWPKDESWQKLDETIRSAVQVRIGTNDLPFQSEISLQTIIREWQGSRQTQALRQKVQELALLRLRLAQDCVPLLDEYSQTLQSYLQSREQPTGTGFLGLRKRTAQRQALEETLRKLEELDSLRLSERPPPRSQPSGQVTTASK